MKKNLRYLIASLLALMMLLSLCACAQTGTASGSNGGLDLDYVGEETDQPEEEKPWYSWITDAFSFGKKEKTTTPSQSKPDSVADFYAQGSSDVPEGNKSNKADQPAATTPDEENTNTATNPGGKKDDSKKNDQKAEDNTPTPTPEQKPDSKKNTVTITIRCDRAARSSRCGGHGRR